MSAVLEEAISPQSLSVTLPVTDDLRAALDASRRAPANLIIIDSAIMAQEAANEMTASRGRERRLEALYKGFIEPANKIIEHARGLFKPAILAEQQLQSDLKRGLSEWTEKEERRIALERAAQEEAERKARQEAERKAAEERAKAEEAARQKEEQARREEEARARAEAESREAAERARKAREEGDIAAAKAAEDERRRLEAEARAAAEAAAKSSQQASAAMENAEHRAQQAHITAAAMVATAVIQQTKIAGAAMRDNWIAKLAPNQTEESAKMEIVKAIAAGRTDLLGVIDVNTSNLNKLAKGLKTNMVVPGYVPYNDRRIAGVRR